MIKGSCHCGAVTVEIPRKPDHLTQCNCSICRRLGSIMCYFPPREVTITAAPGATQPYIWGDKMLDFHHCKVCGVTTHWEGLDPKGPDRMGINSRLFDPKDMEGVRVRRFDGADTWQFLD